jgi:DNA/RNA-binding domain of Phe-tRNA-synthetase-like protein
MKIVVSEEIKKACPNFIGAAVMAKVINSEYDESLSKEIDGLSEQMRITYNTEQIKNISAIEATRRVYRILGKDPSRYRPSGEALVRRILKGQNLYHIDTLVDLINLASMKFGYSIGGFDSDKIVGDKLILGVGKHGEPYEGIGRGPLNIEGLPVYRDAIGGIGTPTSDHERTKMGLATVNILALVNGYDGNKDTVIANACFIQKLLGDYCQSDGGKWILF